MSQDMHNGKRAWRPTRTYWIAVIALLAVLAGLVAYQVWGKSSRLPVLMQVNDFTLQKMDGTPLTFSQLNGKVKLVSFIYINCPDVCPVTTHYMAKLQEDLKEKGLFGSKVDFITITFDPERDTPDQLAAYAEKFGADLSGWHFLTGTEAETKQVANSFGIAVEKQDNGLFLHTMKTLLVDKDQNIRRIYGMGADMNLEEIVRDIRQLARE